MVIERVKIQLEQRKGKKLLRVANLFVRSILNDIQLYKVFVQ